MKKKGLPRRGSSRRGFTLIEILLTLAILAAVFFPLMQMFTQGFLASSDANSTTIAINLAQKKMEEMKNLSFDSIASESRTAVSGFSGFESEITVTTPQANLKQIQITLYWQVSGTGSSYTLTSYAANF